MLEKAIISGVTHTTEETVYRVEGLALASLCTALAGAAVNVDTILQATPLEVVFSAPDSDHEDTARVLDSLGVRWSARGDLGKVSLVGAGMKSHPGIAAKMFAVLAEEGIEAQVVNTSTIKIACHIASDDVPQAVRALHRAFALDDETAERAHA